MILPILSERGQLRLRDHEGLVVRLSPERLAHILEHPEMMDLEQAIGETLQRPDTVMHSLSDSEVRLYYRFYTGTRVGDKLLCIVVKVAGDDAYILTAYLTDKVKRGVVLWPEKR